MSNGPWSMRCSFCDTEGHPSLRVIPVPTTKRRSPSTAGDPQLALEYGGACDGCVEEINKAGWFDRG